MDIQNHYECELAETCSIKKQNDIIETLMMSVKLSKSLDNYKARFVKIGKPHVLWIFLNE